jgi:hypothetical protein
VADTIPGARLHVVQGGGHFPNRTHRAEVQAAIARFLDALGAVGEPPRMSRLDGGSA